MHYQYEDMTIEFPFDIIHVLDFNLTEQVLAHTYLQLTCLIDSDHLNHYIKQLDQRTRITVSQFHTGILREAPFFVGKVLQWNMALVQSGYVLKLNLVSLTHDFDIEIKSRTFSNLTKSYQDVFEHVFKGGSLPFVDQIQKDQLVLSETKLTHALIQYEETDWAFIKRLASHFNAVLFTNAVLDRGRFTVGIPRFHYRSKITRANFTVVNDTGKHDGLKARIKSKALEDVLIWEVRDVERLYVGEQLVFNGETCIVTGLRIHLEDERLQYTYTLQKETSLRIPKQFNQKLAGLSLPATVNERRGNTIQVRYAIDDDQPQEHSQDYVYNLGSCGHYCMPEIDSQVHVYFSTADEATAYATNAIRTPFQGGNKPDRAANPDIQSFSYLGSLMEMSETGVTFSPDHAEVLLSLSQDGVMHLSGNQITLETIDGNIEMGERASKKTIKAEEEASLAPVVPKQVMLYGKEQVTFMRGDDSESDEHVIMLEQNHLTFIAEEILKEGEGSPVEGYSEAVAALTAGDEALRQAVNEATQAASLRRINDAIVTRDEARRTFLDNGREFLSNLGYNVRETGRLTTAILGHNVREAGRLTTAVTDILGHNVRETGRLMGAIKPFATFSGELPDINMRRLNTQELPDINMRPLNARELPDINMRWLNTRELSDINMRPLNTRALVSGAGDWIGSNWNLGVTTAHEFFNRRDGQSGNMVAHGVYSMLPSGIQDLVSRENFVSGNIVPDALYSTIEHFFPDIVYLIPRASFYELLPGLIAVIPDILADLSRALADATISWGVDMTLSSLKNVANSIDELVLNGFIQLQHTRDDVATRIHQTFVPEKLQNMITPDMIDLLRPGLSSGTLDTFIWGTEAASDIRNGIFDSINVQNWLINRLPDNGRDPIRRNELSPSEQCQFDKDDSLMMNTSGNISRGSSRAFMNRTLVNRKLVKK